jgi:uncharacterized protein YbcC (UPF0753/DUF2309 family)
MTWEPGRPVLTAQDWWQQRCAEYERRKARKLEQQRQRRARHRRIDYYPSPEVQALIDARCGPRAGGDYSRVIDALILAGIPE